MLTSSGFLRDLSEFLWQDGAVLTHPDWPESLAAELIAVFMGDDKYIWNKLGKLRANGMSIIVGASGVSFKTVAIKHSRILLKRIMEILNDTICRDFGFSSYKNYVDSKKFHEMNKPFRRKGRPTNEEKEEYTKWEKDGWNINNVDHRLVDYEGPTKFTSEGLSIFLQRFPQIIILGDEYTKLFKGASKKDFLTDNMEDLSRLFDCESDKYATASRGIDYPEDAYVCFTSATTTYLFKLMNEDFFLQGTGNRIKWIFDDLEDRQLVDVEKEVMKTEFFWVPHDEDEYYRRLNELAQKLISIRDLPSGVMLFDEDSSIILDRYRLECYNKALVKIQKNLFDIDANLMSRLAENAIKLAMIHCVGRTINSLEEGEHIGRLFIKNVDALWAVQKMDRHLEHFTKMMAESIKHRKGAIRIYKIDQERVLSEIEGNQTLTVSKLSATTGWSSEDTLKLVAQMVKNKQIIMFYEMRKYRGSQVYYLRRYSEEEERISKLNRLNWLKVNDPERYRIVKLQGESVS